MIKLCRKIYFFGGFNMEIVVFIIAFIIANIIVKGFRQMVMKITGAQSMFFSVKGHFIATGLLALVMAGLVLGY